MRQARTRGTILFQIVACVFWRKALNGGSSFLSPEVFFFRPRVFALRGLESHSEHDQVLFRCEILRNHLDARESRVPVCFREKAAWSWPGMGVRWARILIFKQGRRFESAQKCGMNQTKLKTMKAKQSIIGRLTMGCVFTCCFAISIQTNARVYDPALKQKGAGIFFNTNQNQSYAVFQVNGFDPSGFYFVTSKTNLEPGVAPIWNTYALEGYLQAPAATNLLCRYGIPLNRATANFFRIAAFDGTYNGLFAPSSSIVYPTNGQVVNLVSNHYFQAKGDADDAQAICQITLSFDGQVVAKREADYPGDALNYKFSSYFLPSGEHTLFQTVHNFGSDGVPTNDLHIDRLTTDSDPVTFTVSNNFAYVSPSPISMEGDGYSLTIETPWTNRLLTAQVINSFSNVIQVLTNYSGDDGIVSFAWDGNDANSEIYTNDWIGFKLVAPSQNFQGPSGTIPQLNLYRSKPTFPGKISFAHQNIGLINNQARTMLGEAHTAADFWANQNFPAMRPFYRDEPRRVPDSLSTDQWLNDLLSVREVWVVCHTAWSYGFPYSMPGGMPFTTGDKTSRQGLFGDGNQLVSVRQISDKLKNLFDYQIYSSETGEIPHAFSDENDNLWARFSFKHIMSSVYLDSCYSALTSLPMAFGFIPYIYYGANVNASFFGWTIDEQYESGIFSPYQVHFSTTFNAAYILDPTISVGMGDAASGAGVLYGISPQKYAVFGNPQHPYAKP
jgi:hypothetical protein